MGRIGNVKRITKETDVMASVEIDGTGKTSAQTNIPFLNHLLTTLATHSLMDVKINATGDLAHHVVEDVAITLGQAISKALGDRTGIARFGWALIPMDEALAIASVDLVRRPHSSIELKINKSSIENLSSEDLVHFLQSLATSIQGCLHVNVQYGENAHHKVEAAFKALALSLRQACMIDTRHAGSTSSKGVL